MYLYAVRLPKKLTLTLLLRVFEYLFLPKRDSRSHMFPFLSGDFMKSFMHGILFGAPWLII
jgi:hypothetical protein